MSQSAATATRVIARPARRIAPGRPQLQLVTPAARRPSNLPFVLLCSLVLSMGLLAVLWLNMMLSQGAYELHELEGRSALLADQEAAAQADLAATSSAGQLARRAGQLGLVPAGSPLFLKLPDGQVLGVIPKEPAKDPLTVVDEGGGAAASRPATVPGTSSAASTGPSAAVGPSEQTTEQTTGQATGQPTGSQGR